MYRKKKPPGFLDIIVVFPFSLPIPTHIIRPVHAVLVFARVLPQPNDRTKVPKIALRFNFVTAPFIAVLLLLAIGAIGREEVKNGIIGDNGHVRTNAEREYLLILFLAGLSQSISWRSS